MQITWQYYAIASAFFASLTAILGKIGVEKIHSDLATLIRTVIVLFILLLLVSWKKAWSPIQALDHKSLLFLFLSALATGFSWICYYRALQMGKASQVAPLDKLSVGLAVCWAVIFLGESLSWKVIVGTLMILCGTILVSL